MKRTLILSCLLLVGAVANAQWWGNRIKGNGDVTTETRNVGDFDRVAVGGFFDVELVAGTEGKVTIEGESNLLEYIITEVKGGKLVIKTKKNTNIRTTEKMKVTVPFEDIDGVSLGGSGDVYSKALIKATNFNTSLAGSGDIELRIQAQTVEASLAGSGDMVLSGSTQDVTLRVAGSGDIDAKNLDARNADVSISGSGDIDLVCDGGDIRGRVSGSGNITYSGNANREDVKVSGSGRIRNKN